MSVESLITECESIYETDSDVTNKTLEKVVCLRCSRPLTNEKSRLARLGPKCARKLVYETRTQSYSSKTLQWYLTKSTTSRKNDSIPTQYISLYYLPNSSSKPCCKIGVLSLKAIENNQNTNSHYHKRSYVLPLIEGLTYQVFQALPEPRTFWLQVQDLQLCERSFSGCYKDPSSQGSRVK